MEAVLEEQLAEYDSQLSQLAEGLCAIPEDDPGYAELLGLQSQITELKRLTEEQLFLEKKARLLGQYGGEDYASLVQEAATPEKSNADDAPRQLFQPGDLCRVPYRHVWGGVQMFSGMVLDCRPDDTAYRVHFLTPIDKSLKTCPHFLKGHCRFGDKCNMSHGYVVSATDVQDYEAPDYGRLSQGASCLAEYEKDGLWYHATVQRVDASGDPLFTVKFRHNHATTVLGADKLIPYGAHANDTYETSSSSEDEDGTHHSHHKPLPEHISELGDSDAGSEQSPRPNRSHSPASNSGDDDRAHRAGYKGDMAKWEESTKGFGSRMLAKMGYVMGTGLKPGALVAPVKVETIPAGISLDYVAELRSKRANGPKKGDLGSENTAMIPTKQKPKAPNVFHFLNTALANPAPRGVASSAPKNEDFVLRKESSKSSINLQATATDLRRNLFSLQETIRQVEKRLASDQQSLDRNIGRDRIMAEHAQGKVNDTTRELQALLRQKELIEKKLGSGSQKEKSIF